MRYLGCFLCLVGIFQVAHQLRQQHLCLNGQFRCPLSGRCVPPSSLCDRFEAEDCPNGEDQTWEFARCGRSPRCPRRNITTAQRKGIRKCRKACEYDFDCSGNKTCQCDGPCGKSCFNVYAGCERDPPTVKHASPAIYRFNSSYYNGHMLQEVVGPIMYGDIVEYTCPVGMVAEGDEIFCTSRRRWSNGVVQCVLSCRSDEEKVENYDLTCGHHCQTNDDCSSLGENYICACDGPCGRTCVSSEVDCGEPDHIENARIEYEGTGIYRKAHYVCYPGYHSRNGVSIVFCSGSGRWYGEIATCEVVYCGSPAESINRTGGMMSSNAASSYTANDTVSFTCPPDRRMLGAPLRTCGYNGRWDGMLTICDLKADQASRCPEPGFPVNGGRRGNSFQVNDTVTFYCNDGYVLRGVAQQQCLWYHDWSGGGAPQCVDPRYRDDEAEMVQSLRRKIGNLHHRKPTLGRTIHLDFKGGHEIYFVFDASKSIGDAEFDYSITFAKKLVEQMFSSSSDVKFGILVFASKVSTVLDPSSHSNPNQHTVMSKLDEVKKKHAVGHYTDELKGGTFTNKALIKLNEIIALTMVNENHAQRHIFIFTDGKHNEGSDPKDTRGRIERQYQGLVEFYSITSCKECHDEQGGEAYAELLNLATTKENFMFIDFYLMQQALESIINSSIDYNKCGVNQEVVENSLGRIGGGRNVKLTWPWQCLFISTKIQRQHIKSVVGKGGFGGGSLINDRWVLTAAHVVSEMHSDDYVIAVGIFEIPENEARLESLPIKFFKTKANSNHVHSNYGDDGRYSNDVALVRVGQEVIWKRTGKFGKFVNGEFDGKVPLSPYVRPVCLPCTGSCVKSAHVTTTNGQPLLNVDLTEEEQCAIEGKWLIDGRENSSSRQLIVTGFGATSNVTLFTSKLNEATLKIGTDQECREGMIRTNDAQPGHVYNNKSHFCTLHPPTALHPSDACKGDSGGPIVTKIKNITTGESCFVQVGIVSYGFGCLAQDANGAYYPGYQTDVTRVFSWIRNITQITDTTV